MASSSFVYLPRERRLGHEEIPRLGRFVCQPHNPSYRFVPNNPQESYLTENDIAKPVRSQGSDISSTFKSRQFLIELKKLLRLSFDELRSENVEVENSAITIERLPQPYEAFEKMRKKPEVQHSVGEMMKDNGGEVYMITAIKYVNTGKEGTIQHTNKAGKSVDKSVRIPISEPPQSLGLALPDIDPKVMDKTAQSREGGGKVRLIGNQVCAIEYFVIRVALEQMTLAGRSYMEEQDAPGCCFYCLAILCCCRPKRGPPPGLPLTGETSMGSTEPATGVRRLEIVQDPGSLVSSMNRDRSRDDGVWQFNKTEGGIFLYSDASGRTEEN